MRLRYNSRAPVAQLDRASGFEPAGRRFNSCRAHHLPTLSSSTADSSAEPGLRYEILLRYSKLCRSSLKLLRAGAKDYSWSGRLVSARGVMYFIAASTVYVVSEPGAE